MCARQGLPLPAKIANAPELFMGLEIYYIAFLDLSTCRALGQGSEGPIPWNAALQWADEHELSREQKEDLFYHLSVMDNVYLSHRAKKMKEELSKSAKGKK